MSFQAPRGTVDLLADDLARWEALERSTRALANRYGLQEIRTPIFEDAPLFLRSVGETTDIVQKEMFTFTDRGGRPLVLRPEGTSAIVRAFLEHNLHKTQGQAKIFYLGPMFRAERPQAGRFRQFHQYGVEAIGSHSPWMDAEVIAFCLESLAAAGVANASLLINSMGCRDDQRRSAEALRERLRPRVAELCPECQARFEKNVFRMLDCKNPTCRALAWEKTPDGRVTSPFLLCQACQDHFQTVKSALTRLNIAFDDTQVFARGLDYYTRTVFEVKAGGLGAQDAVAAGGRYDHLVEELGGPSMGAVGFAAGIERVLRAAEAGAAPVAEPGRRGLYIAVPDAALTAEAFGLAHRLRREGLAAIMDHDSRSFKAQLREADKLRCRWVGILGERERQQGTLAVKDLERGEQREIPQAEVAARLGRDGASTS
jgi:histidyl-tRNA synthetase